MLSIIQKCKPIRRSVIFIIITYLHDFFNNIIKTWNILNKHNPNSRLILYNKITEGYAAMKQMTKSTDVRSELLYLKKQIQITESKISFTSDPKLLDALSYEMLGFKSRMGYLLENAKSDISRY